MLKKLGVIRGESMVRPCPFGLSLKNVISCRNAGDTVNNMTPLLDVDVSKRVTQKDANIMVYTLGAAGEKCVYADKIVEDNTAVHCDHEEGGQGIADHPMAPNSRYPRIFNGNGYVNFYAYPLENLWDSTDTYNMMSGTPSRYANQDKYSDKLVVKEGKMVLKVADMNLEKLLGGDAIEIVDAPETIVDEDEILESDLDYLDSPAALHNNAIPGAHSMSLVEIQPEEELKERNWESDGDHGQFIDYLRSKLNDIPSHSGNTTVGCERAISFLRKLDKEISKAIQSDEDNVIDENEAEKLRDLIFDYIEKLETAHTGLSEKKYKKKADLIIGKKVFARINDGTDIKYFISVADGEQEELLEVQLEEPTPEQVTAFVKGQANGFKKEAGQHFYLMADPFLHAITRMVIQAHVTYGKNIDDVYDFFANKYKFNDREHLSVQELLRVKGLDVNKDYARIGDNNYKPFDGKGINQSTVYPA